MNAKETRSWRDVLAHMNLQLFAEPGAQGDGAQATGEGVQAGGETQSGEGAQEKTLTQTEVDKLVVRIRQEERAKAEKAVKAARTEAEKLARMSEEEKANHEREQREAALNAREAALNLRELQATAAEQLTAKDLPVQLRELLDYTDAEKCAASIETMDKTFKAALKAEVDKALKGRTPESGGSTGGGYDMSRVRRAAGLK